MANEQPGRAVDRDELRIRLRPAHPADNVDQELGDAIRTEHRTRRRSRLAAGVRGERRVGVQHGHQLLGVARDARVTKVLRRESSESAL